MRNYFIDIPRAAHEYTINENIALPEKDFIYILFVKIKKNKASTMGYENSEIKLLENKYETAIISASARSAIVDGYVITDKDIKKGDAVKVHLFS